MTPEFSRPVLVDHLSARGTEMDVEAGVEERVALARRFDLMEIVSLRARLRLRPLGGGPLVRVTGSLSAEVVQTCGVTLAPVPATVAEDFELTFGPAEAGQEEVEFAYDDEDPPEPIVGGAIDVGEAVAEHLSLALDPFPRAPGATFEPTPEPADEARARPNPFAVLAGFQQKKG